MEDSPRKLLILNAIKRCRTRRQNIPEAIMGLYAYRRRLLMGLCFCLLLITRKRASLAVSENSVSENTDRVVDYYETPVGGKQFKHTHLQGSKKPSGYPKGI